MNIERYLSNYEMEILENILKGEIKGIKKHEMSYATVAYIAWVNEENEVEFGPCRWGSRNNYITNEGTFDSWSISPFPGAWAVVPKSQIVRVRHIEAI